MNEKQKELIVLVSALTLVASVYLAAFITVYNDSNTYRETTFTVFDVYQPNSERTTVLTYGKGKWVFLGNYTDKFKLDHEYLVIYTTSSDSHSGNAATRQMYLNIVTIKELTK